MWLILRGVNKPSYMLKELLLIGLRLSGRARYLVRYVLRLTSTRP